MDLSLEEEVESLRATPSGLFTLGAIKQVSALRDKIDRTKAKYARVLEYFGEEKDKMQPHELFHIISSFTRDFQKAKEEVFSTVHKRLREDRKKARKQTPQQKNGLPPSGPERSPNKPMLKASSHQPSMSSLFNDIQKRASESNSSNNDHVVSHVEQPTPKATSPYRSMQYQPGISEERFSPSNSPSAAAASAAAAAKESLRQKAMLRQQRYQEGPSQDNVGYIDGTMSKISLAPQMKVPSNDSSSSSSSQQQTLGALPPSGPSTTSRSPRDALRNRRRMEAMRSRHHAMKSSSAESRNPR
jgi:hypothetical protein